jgi:uncharacterized OB-fold protein
MSERRPLPSPNPDTLRHWKGLNEGRLLIQKCADCGKLRHYPRPVCDACLSMQALWIESSGRGVVHSWTETHHAFLPGFKSAVPYILVTVDLEEGVRVNAPYRGGEGQPEIGMPVECSFEAVTEEWMLPFFVPARLRAPYK